MTEYYGLSLRIGKEPVAVSGVSDRSSWRAPGNYRYLYEVDPADPASLAAAGGALLLAGALAAYLPARRVSRVDPVEALRAE